MTLRQRIFPWYPYIWVLYGFYEMTIWQFRHGGRLACIAGLLGFLNAWLDLNPKKNPGLKLAAAVKKRLERHEP
jgi:hypothetical protein